MTVLPIGLLWKLRRVAAGLRQQDVARIVGISSTRYSAIERGEEMPNETDRMLIEKTLPLLPKTKERVSTNESAQAVAG